MAIASGYGRAVKLVAVKPKKIYSVTVSPSEIVCNEAQLLTSIFESMYAVTNDRVQKDANPAPSSEPEKSMKGDSA